MTATLVGFRPALERLTAALDVEAGLTAAGRQAAAAALAAAAETQLRLRELAAGTLDLATHLSDTAAVGPVAVITGLHRTGTTLLQNLLAEHPGLRVPRLWELMWPVSGRDPAEHVSLLARTVSYVEEYYRAAPAFRAIHPLDARRPEECHRLTGLSFMSEIYGLRYRVPGYLDWLAAQDHRPAYALHLAALRAILWRVPGPPVVVLKCPFHLWHADALAATYPSARVIRLHRDPAVTIPSICSLTAVVRAARAARVDRAEIGADWLSRTEAVLGSADGFGGLPVLDVRYPDLVADPLAVAGIVCDFVGVPVTAAAERGMREYLRSNPVGVHGVHRYRAEDFGLSTPDLVRRFSAYRERYQF